MNEYSGQTDEAHRIELPSAIERVGWTRLRAAPGGTAGLEIRTRYVGHGAPFKIQLLDGKGRSHGTFKDQIASNHFQAEIRVPEKARQALVADVRLPKHGLQQTSPALLLTPPVTIKNAAWSKEEARRGNVLTLSADVEGAPDGTGATVTILEHDADGAHDLLTRFPVLVEGGKVEAEWEYEYHEDTDDIPTEEEAEKGYQPPEYFFRVEVHGLTAESELLTFKDWIEIEMKDPFGRPLAGEEYVLYLPDGRILQGSLDDHGRVRQTGVPPGRYRIEYPGLE